MDILMIDHFSPGNAYSEELCNALGDLINVKVISKENACAFSGKVRQLPLLYNGGAGKIEAACKYLSGLFKQALVLNSNKCDVIHIQTFKNASLEIKMYLILLRNKKIVHTVHNVLPHETKNGDRELYLRFYNRCDALIVHNDVCKNILVDNFGIDSQKIYVIPHGAYNVKPPIMRNDYGKKHFLMFGVIRHYKGVDILLEAISNIPGEKRQNMEFIIAGRQYSNQDATDYSAIIQRLGIADCTKLINRRIDDGELPELFGWADACVFPYREIYGSGALLMAYAYRKPVIASDVPVFVEETDRGATGLLFKSEDSIKLADALIQCADWGIKDTEEYVQAIDNLVQKKYNWTVAAEKTVDVYSQVLKKT